MQILIALQIALRVDFAQNASDARREIFEEQGVLAYVEVTRKSKQRSR